MHQLAAFLHQKLQSPRSWCVGVQPPELVSMERQDIQEESGITGIVLGAGGAKAFSVVRQRRRVNRENDQMVIFRQHKHQRPPGLFPYTTLFRSTGGPRDCSSATAMGCPRNAAGARTPRPLRLRGCDRWFQFPALTIRLFAAPRRASDQPNQWLRVQRIQLAWFVLCPIEIWVRQPLPPRKPYSKVLISQTTSENSFRSKVHPAAPSSTDGHRVSARTIRSGGVPAQVHNGKIRSCRQGRDFHSARPATTVENPFLNISPSESL